MKRERKKERKKMKKRLKGKKEGSGRYKKEKRSRKGIMKFKKWLSHLKTTVHKIYDLK